MATELQVYAHRIQAHHLSNMASDILTNPHEHNTEKTVLCTLASFFGKVIDKIMVMMGMGWERNYCFYSVEILEYSP